MTTTLTKLPGIGSARLPATYQAATKALAECSRIDECLEWTNKAIALASYAKQAGDETLHRYADRIKARAIRRCGQLATKIDKGKPGPRIKPLTDKQIKKIDAVLLDLRNNIITRDASNRKIAKIDPHWSERGNEELKAGADPQLSRKAAADSAGLSPRQLKTAIRVANVPDADFDRQVESEKPPTITALADQGKQLRGKSSVAQFQIATEVIGSLRQFSEFAKRNDAAEAALGIQPTEVAFVRQQVALIDAWLDRFIVSLK